MIAWSGSDVAIDLQTPAYNILGFEYAPTSDAEKALLAERIAALETGALLQFSPDAECTVVSASVQTGFSEEGHDAEGHDLTFFPFGTNQNVMANLSLFWIKHKTQPLPRQADA